MHTKRINLLQVAVKIFLIAVVPLVLLGWRNFEGTSLYAQLTGLSGVDTAIENKLTTQYGPDKTKFVRLDVDETAGEFKDLWSLAKMYSDADLSKGQPSFIARFAVSNATTISMPGKPEVFLIPESVPVVAVYCPEFPANCKGKDAVVLGNVRDIRAWRQARKDAVGAGADLILSIIAIVFGLLLEFRFFRA
jgi:hypothetical protein